MTLRTRLVLSLAYVVFLAIVALEIPLAFDLRDRVDAEVRSQAHGQADLVAASSVDLLRPHDRRRLDTVVASAARTVRGRVIVVDPTGTVLSDSARPATSEESYANRPEIAAALNGHTLQQTRHSDSLNADILATAVPISDGRRVRGAVRITQSVSSVNSAVRRTVVELVLVGFAVLLIGLIAGAFLAGQISRPLRRLERTARRVAEGELDARAPEEGSAEQRSLARSFNEMTTRLRELLEAQRRFVADASHQLRTPLAGLRLRLEAARSRQPDDRDLIAAESEVQRLSKIIDDLLALSRADEARVPPASCSLGAGARRALERFRAAAAKAGARLVIAEEAPGAVGCCTDAELDRMLDVLIENALAYGTAGGIVELAVFPGVVEVRDRGPGPAAGEEELVFERFHRGAASHLHGGTGLGLSIARAIARDRGGDVTLRAREGGGAVAAVVVPREPAPARAAEPSPDRVPA